jgi:hypothetical protein
MHTLDSTPPRSRKAVLRAVFFFGYLGVQVALLLHAQSTPDFVFGFQMFNASSEMKISLFRKLGPHRQHAARLIPVRDGVWQAKDSHGELHELHWNDRVRDSTLSALGRYVHASYGLDAQLFRLQYALDDVARHLTDDSETQALVAVVDTRKNGRGGAQVRLTGARE